MAERLDDYVNQRRYYESLIAVSPTAIVTTDADFQVTSWNPAAEKLFGFTAAEAIGSNVDDLVCNDEQVRAEGLEMDRLALRGASPKIHAPNPEEGTLIDVALRGAPIVVADRFAGSYAFYDDIGIQAPRCVKVSRGDAVRLCPRAPT